MDGTESPQSGSNAKQHSLWLKHLLHAGSGGLAAANTFFYTFLYYTDMGAVTLILASYLASPVSIKGRSWGYDCAKNVTNRSVIQ